MIKPIQTRYKGYHFRSRLEARWAVFFDALGIEWEYEPEGFELPDGTRYLPDFCLTGTGYRQGQGLYVEVKPTRDLSSFTKARAFSAASGAEILCAGGMPDHINFPTFIEGGDAGGVEFTSCSKYGPIFWAPGVEYWMPCDNVSPWEAIAAARSARFEHGESGRT